MPPDGRTGVVDAGTAGTGTTGTGVGRTPRSAGVSIGSVGGPEGRALAAVVVMGPAMIATNVQKTSSESFRTLKIAKVEKTLTNNILNTRIYQPFKSFVERFGRRCDRKGSGGLRTYQNPNRMLQLFAYRICKRTIEAYECNSTLSSLLHVKRSTLGLKENRRPYPSRLSSQKGL